ncbi:MAG TPA: type II toxin-antitoxin system MqsA family antitoxin [Herbaspirillum sp.]|uniref:type II toxin-antitoxin system MqsA family antitoxin n=1 Tax=Herbaspirillum sp. TaxID=1890675 RepID=UPI002D51B53A|nr:type II toxin-antitoxin system MqsA family antitoxin [Herbaspirillum sp.]HZG18619.1 type II toxin-antitoxin system MqsA family antitoxin [Herbaspirillum sp.]
MKCPTCGKGELINDTRDVPYSNKGNTTIFPGVTADFCTTCDEYLTSPSETQRVMEMMRAFNQRFESTSTRTDEG